MNNVEPCDAVTVVGVGAIDQAMRANETTWSHCLTVPCAVTRSASETTNCGATASILSDTSAGFVHGHVARHTESAHFVRPVAHVAVHSAAVLAHSRRVVFPPSHLMRPVGHGHIASALTHSPVAQRVGVFGLHGQRSCEAAHEPSQHLTDVVPTHALGLTQSSLLTTHTLVSGQRVGRAAGQSHWLSVAAHLLFQHVTGVSPLHVTVQLACESAQRPLSHLNGEDWGHGQRSNDAAHDESQHCTSLLAHRTQRSLVAAHRRVSGQNTGAVAGQTTGVAHAEVAASHAQRGASQRVARWILSQGSCAQLDPVHMQRSIGQFVTSVKPTQPVGRVDGAGVGAARLTQLPVAAFHEQRSETAEHCAATVNLAHSRRR